MPVPPVPVPVRREFLETAVAAVTERPVLHNINLAVYITSCI